MDVDTNISEYLGLIKGQKQLLQSAKSRQGQRPRDRKPKEQIWMEFMMASMSTNASKQRGDNHMIHSSFIPPAYLPCTTPLAQLTPILIKQLTLETHHRGRYLLLKVVAPPNRMTAILTLTVDETDDVVVLQLYQQEDEQVRPATDVVDVGMMLLTKEPYFKIMANGDYGLRVDHLSDIVHIRKGDPILPKAWYQNTSRAKESAEVSKSKGDAAVGAGKYWEAIEEYSKALLQSPPSERITVIKRNRSLAYLKTKQFDNALSDTGFPNFGSALVEKALFRAAEALYSLQRFDECRSVLEKLLSAFPSNKQAKQINDRVRSRQSEASSGAYDFKLLQEEAKQLHPPQLDHATYIGPIEVKASPGKGRGLFTTKPVQAGDLLLCEKAFGHAFVSRNGKGGSSQVSLLINSETDRAFMGGQADLLKQLVQKTYRNPSLSPAFFALHHGEYKPADTVSVDGSPVVDTFLTERIMALNVFGCPRSSLQTYTDKNTDTSEKDTAYHSCGIWIQASYINHSCNSNARRSFIGDMMIVRATRNLAAGEEVSFWYHAPTGEARKQQEKLRNWGFECSCSICLDSRATSASIRKTRKALLQELKAVFQPSQSPSSPLSPSSSPPPNHPTNLHTAERLLRALNATYPRPPHEVPRLLLWDPQALLTRLHLSRGALDNALASFAQTLTLLGFVVTGADRSTTPFEVVTWGLLVDYVVEVLLQGGAAFEAVGRWGDAARAEGYARVAYTMVVGEGSSFEGVCGG